MITILNAAPNTGNQGVSALCLSAVDGLTRRGATGIAVQDHGRGHRHESWTIAGRQVDVNLIGLSHIRRPWRGDCLRTVRTMARLGGAGNPAARVIAQSRAVLDVSGGDSFTDLYGEKRFRAMVLSKQLALDNGLTLILLPQTLGPFRDAGRRAEAVAILRGARGIWLRDAGSYAFLQQTLGDEFDAARHHLGVDMAVLLPRALPTSVMPMTIAAWLAPGRDFPVAGLNVSGLLCHDPDAAKAQFGLAARHTDQTEAAARAVLESDPEMRLLLVPHVQRPDGDPESDGAAALALRARLARDYGDRVQVLPQTLSAMELKGVIAKLDWFAGARMHATIAGFSSGVPTLGLGYSDKAAGVFAECGIGAHVADLRRMDADAVGAAVRASLDARDRTRAALARTLPGVLARAESQMDAIAASIGLAHALRRAA
jgi:polysaccharide pyruvyl transferase WcaK-like protein